MLEVLRAPAERISMRLQRSLPGWLLTGTLALGAATVFAEEKSPDFFEDPVRLQAGGDFVDSDVGHAAPYLADFDGDGKIDLLVGQFGDGMLRVHKNVGTNENPKYAKHEFFQVNGEDVKVPTG